MKIKKMVDLVVKMDFMFSPHYKMQFHMNKWKDH
jgi:hypothetical protein